MFGNDRNMEKETDRTQFSVPRAPLKEMEPLWSMPAEELVNKCIALRIQLEITASAVDILFFFQDYIDIYIILCDPLGIL